MTGRTPISVPKREVSLALLPIVAAATLAALVPSLDLASGLADWMVVLTDTASWGGMPWVSAAAIAFVGTRPGVSGNRRAAEVAALAVVMLIVLAGNGLLNEDVVKPLFSATRPNIERLASEGFLGPDYPTATALYEAGTKSERRLILEEVLPATTTLGVTARVRSHWVHEAGYSFPSGHATTAVTFATLMVLIGLTWMSGWRRRVLVGLVVTWATGVVLTRVLLEVHRTVDTLVGAAAGVVWGLVIFTGVQWLIGLLARRDTLSSRPSE